MQETFWQYNLIRELVKKHSHLTYLASPINPQRGHSEPDCQVVLTVFASSLFRFPHERKDLLQKAQRFKDCQHPHLMPILDMGIEEEQPFVVRQYLPKGSLRHRLKQLFPDRLELRDALTLVLQAGEALAYAHKYGIFHGNIKPENILFDANDQIVLTDFHLLSRKDALIRDQTTEEYAFCYMAPEQFAGTCNASSDQYALGCLAYELITGRVPFAVQTLASMMGLQSRARPASLSESVADLPPALETAILKTLAEDPAERFFDCSLFLEVIQSVLSPLPTFPFAHAPHLRGNKTLSSPVPSAKAENIVSPIRKRAIKRTAPEPLEPSEAISTAEVTIQELGVTPHSLQASMVEWAGIIPVAESLETVLASYPQTLDDGEDQQTIDPFEQEDADESSAIEATKLVHGNNELTIAQEILPAMKGSEIVVSRNRMVRHSKRRVLELALLLSVIVSVICAAVWFSGILTPDTHSHIPTASLRITKKGIPAIATQITNTPPVQPTMQTTPLATATATVQPSAQATTLPTAQPAPPTPIVEDPPKSYEAEAPQNTLAGGAIVASCAACSGGEKVRYVGGSGTLQFNNVSKSRADNYMLTVYYINGEAIS